MTCMHIKPILPMPDHSPWYRTTAPFTVPFTARSPSPVPQHFTDQGGQIVQQALEPFLQHLMVLTEGH